jgi:hypothetical protein
MRRRIHIGIGADTNWICNENQKNALAAKMGEAKKYFYGTVQIQADRGGALLGGLPLFDRIIEIYFLMVNKKKNTSQIICFMVAQGSG